MRMEDRDTVVSLGRRLYGRWTQEDQPLARRLEKAPPLLFDVARARLYLRQADEVAPDVRVVGRPLVRNHGGRLIIGPGAVLRSIVAPVEIFVGPGATMILGRGVHLNSGSTFAAHALIEI